MHAVAIDARTRDGGRRNDDGEAGNADLPVASEGYSER